MVHPHTRAMAALLSTALAASGVPTPALAAVRALAAQAAGGWVHAGDGWRWRDMDGAFAQNRWVNDGTGWYYLNERGEAASGWQFVSGRWYYLNERHDGGFGRMQTGWKLIADTWYYLGTSGAMHTDGWRDEGSARYYLLPSGAMATGWSWVDGAWRYFDPVSGALATSTTVDGFTVDDQGAWQDTQPGDDVATGGPELVAHVADISLAQDEDGGATATATLVLSALKGSVSLAQDSEVALVDELSDALGEQGSAAPSATAVDTDTVEVEVSFSPEQVAAYQARSDASLEGALTALRYGIASCSLVVRGGAEDAAGAPVDVATAEILAYAPMREGDEGDAADDAQKAMEIISDVLSAAGSFIGAIKDGNIADYFSGAGSVFGLIGKIIGFANEDNVTLRQVMERLNAMDGELRGISTKLDMISNQISRLGVEVKYTQEVKNLRSAAEACLSYQGFVMDAARGLDEGSTATSWDELSQADKDTLLGLREATMQYNTDNGRGSLTAPTVLRLGQLLTSNSALSDVSMAQRFLDYSASAVNWEPETFEQRRLFASYVMFAYTMGYMAAMNEVNAALMSGDVTDAQRRSYEQTRRELMASMEAVNAELGEKSEYQARTRTREGGVVLNTVNGRLFGYWAVVPYMRFYDNDVKTFFGPALSSRDEDDLKRVPTYPTGDFANRYVMSAADYETMASRLPYVRTVPTTAYAGLSSDGVGPETSHDFSRVNSLLDEMELVGISIRGAVSDWWSADSWSSQGGKSVVYFQQNWKVGVALAGPIQRLNDEDKSSNYHRRHYYADVFDVEGTGTSVQRSREVIYYKNVYHWGAARWYTEISINPMFYIYAQ